MLFLRTHAFDAASPILSAGGAAEISPVRKRWVGLDPTRNPKRRRRDTFFSPNTATHYLQSQRLLVRMIAQRENADRNEQSKLAREEEPTLCRQTAQTVGHPGGF